ncbi:hypothetical protein AOQ84DRAFT_442336 [Glonium stellatum]|uniref:Uncharacterized protein n=1 Tax=Glonium stellatum TaxID=574774 RepID=A0A8E2ESG7_9PEZI|nr:hypothetical protein AOQ84DRAFT_442336 [Glonium stellatum]
MLSNVISLTVLWLAATAHAIRAQRTVLAAMLIIRKAPTTASLVAYAGVAAMDLRGETHAPTKAGKIARVQRTAQMGGVHTVIVHSTTDEIIIGIVVGIPALLSIGILVYALRREKKARTKAATTMATSGEETQEYHSCGRGAETVFQDP